MRSWPTREVTTRPPVRIAVSIVFCWALAASRWAFSCALRSRSAAFWAAAISRAWRWISRCCWAGVIEFKPVAVVGSTPARTAASVAAAADAARAAAILAVIRS